jgi:hypothetical protein
VNLVLVVIGHLSSGDKKPHGKGFVLAPRGGRGGCAKPL